jgi:hypothetical protein
MPSVRGNLTNLGALNLVKHDRIDKGRRSGLLMHVGGGWVQRGASVLSVESGRPCWRRRAATLRQVNGATLQAKCCRERTSGFVSIRVCPGG